MKIPLEWLKEYVTTRLSPAALAEKLTMAGLEVVGILESEGEPVLDLEITPNRADCLSLIGVAREVAIFSNTALKLPKFETPKGPASSRALRERVSRLTIRIDEREGCSRYIGRLIGGLTVGPSPAWMQKRLAACGIRPINNVVDVTNYVLLEYGQPLHAFDAARLCEDTIIVRRSRSGEALTTLDGLERKLSPDILVIADGARAVAVAGVMGGVGSEVSAQTREVLLESALFDPLTVRRGARRLGLTTDSSYRFERGVDAGSIEAASARAAALMCELAGGEEWALRDVGTKPAKRTTVLLDERRASRWLGMELSPTAIRTTLARLSCRVASSSGSEALRVEIPSFRRDLKQEADLYEELARLIGYDQLPSTLPAAPLAAAGAEEPKTYERLQSLKCLCASLGLDEAITWSLVSEADLSRCGFEPAQAIRLANPLSQDHALLRPSLLIGLLQAFRRNLSRGRSSAHFFEVGSVAPLGQSDSKEIEEVRVGILLSGLWYPDWRTSRIACDFYALKGLVQALAQRLCAGEMEMEPAAHPWSEASESAFIRLEKDPVGVAGKVSRRLLEALDVEQEVWVAELSVPRLLVHRRPAKTIRPPALFPSVKRDLSFMIDQAVPFEAIRRLMEEVAGAQADRLELVDLFTQAPVPAGKKSLTFSIEYRDPSRTLTASEAEALHGRLREALVEKLKATLR